MNPSNRLSFQEACTATGMVCSSFLVEVEKVDKVQMKEWKKQYPEAFEREYNATSGLCFDGWVSKNIYQTKKV